MMCKLLSEIFQCFVRTTDLDQEFIRRVTGCSADELSIAGKECQT